MYQQALLLRCHGTCQELLLKPLRAWDYPSGLPFVPQRRCLLYSGILFSENAANFFYNIHLFIFFLGKRYYHLVFRKIDRE